MTTLTPGTRLGCYEIVALIGMGGMGEVYRARDTKLNRDVALKALPATVADDPQRLSRFKREAQLLASLNHPNIGAIFGFEDSSQVHALVLELIDGPTLAEKLQGSSSRSQRPLDPQEALRVARQIADALEAAHDHGIIHRDLKPANIKVRLDGTVKVLDFGLAKALDLPSDDGVGSGADDLTLEPVASYPTLTSAGSVMGTAAYMSPEQARGEPLDARADIWAFGCVVFEMLANRRVFPGNTGAEAIAAVLTIEPDWHALPPTTPEPIRRLLRRCLTKDPKQRLRHISDARIEISDALSGPAHVVAPQPAGPPASHRSRTSTTVAIASVIALVAAGLGWSLRRPSAPVERRLEVARVLIAPTEPLSDDVESPIAISPDGREIAYVAGKGAARRVFRRRLDQYDSKPVPGTEGADFPTFSPDGRWLAFVADRKLKKADLTAGTTFVLSDLRETEGAGLSWRQPGTILFSGGRSSGIRSISASGGATTEITTLALNETYHRYPDSLPDGSTLLFSDIAGNGGQQVYAQSLKTKERRRITAGAGARFLSTGHIAYVSGTTLYAVPFDPARLETTGEPIGLIEGIAQAQLATPEISISDVGTIAYISSTGATQAALVWVDKNGVESPAGPPTEPIHFARLSPDGRRVSMIAGDVANNSGDVRLYDFTRETWNRLTSDGNVTFAIWRPDGSTLTQGSTVDGRYRVDTHTFDGNVTESLLTDSSASYPLSWSPDGRHLALVIIGASTGQDIHVIDRQNPGKLIAFVTSRFREGAPTFSPDGRWIAYVSEKSGRAEIYMRPFPGPGEEWTLSTDGGTEPNWARSAPTLFYRQGDAMMAVDITTSPMVSAGKPRKVFERRYQRTSGFWPNYDVTSDGQRFLMIKRLDQRPSTHINVVLNWLDELRTH